MYIISLTYKTALENVQKHLDAHIEYLKEQYATGIFLASGRKIPRTGGIIFAKADNPETLRKILEKDPFHTNNIADYEITEFIASMTCDELAFLKEV